MERKPIEYKVFTESSSSELSEKINQALKEGWVLYGNPFYLPPIGGYPNGWAQAMIRQLG